MKVVLYILGLTVLACVTAGTQTEKANGGSFSCRPETSSGAPTSVHRLRPSDIDIIGGVGDSLTAGSGIFAKTIAGVLVQFRGHSFTMGGATDLSDLVTLPNILKKFNANLRGYSTGVGGPDSASANFNVAVFGDKANALPDQARKLVARMQESLDSSTYRNSWKLINVFTGPNDICRQCFDEAKYSPANFTKHIRDTLDYLKANVPRAFVNVISTVDASIVADIVKDKRCKQLYVICPCATLRPRDQAEAYVSELHRRMEELVNSGRYDTSDDFTAVLQPFLKRSTMPTNRDGSVDRSYFSPDCFHFGAKLHAVSGVYLWKNMLEPVGSKTEKMEFPRRLTIDCPAASQPYLTTSKNS